MATQKRTGGVEKIGLPLADEHSVRKVIRSLAGIFDLDLVSRMFKDESIPCSKLVGGVCGSEQIVFLEGRSDLSISNPTLNTWAEYPLSSFSSPLPNCRAILASVYIFTSGNFGDFYNMSAGYIDGTAGNIIIIFDGTISNSGTVGIGVVVIPTIGDSLRLYFNGDTSILSVDIQAIAYLP